MHHIWKFIQKDKQKKSIYINQCYASGYIFQKVWNINYPQSFLKMCKVNQSPTTSQYHIYSYYMAVSSEFFFLWRV